MFVTLYGILSDDEGASMVEYSLLLALIALVAFIAVQTLGTKVSAMYATFPGSV